MNSLLFGLIAQNRIIYQVADEPPGTPYVDEVLADNPLYYYRLGDSTSTADDIGSAGRDGTYSGGYTLEEPSLLASDSANKAVLLNGSSGYVSIGNHTENQFTGFDSFTLECLIKLNGFPADGSSYWFMGKAYDSGSNTTGYCLYLLTSGGGSTKTLVVESYNGSSGQGTNYNVSSWSTGTIYHIAATYTYADTTWRLYINGSLVASNSASGAQNSSRPFEIGRENNSFAQTSYFNGVIDEVAVYTTALSDTRIAAHYAATT